MNKTEREHYANAGGVAAFARAQQQLDDGEITYTELAKGVSASAVHSLSLCASSDSEGNSMSPPTTEWEPCSWGGIHHFHMACCGGTFHHTRECQTLANT